MDWLSVLQERERKEDSKKEHMIHNVVLMLQRRGYTVSETRKNTTFEGMSVLALVSFHNTVVNGHALLMHPTESTKAIGIAVIRNISEYMATRVNTVAHFICIAEQYNRNAYQEV